MLLHQEKNAAQLNRQYMVFFIVCRAKLLILYELEFSFDHSNGVRLVSSSIIFWSQYLAGVELLSIL